MRSPKPPSRFLPCRLFSALLLAAIGMAWAVPALSASGRYEALRAQDLRVASVAYRLSLANRGNCRDAIVPQAGLVLHSLGQYGPSDREAAARSFDLDQHPSVMAVVDGSPAAKAGLRPNDRLLAVNGRMLIEGGPGGAEPSRVFLDGINHIIADEMKKGPVVFRVASRDGDRDVAFEAENGCATNIELAPGELINAWADGARVVVSTGILGRCRTDDDLALVIAHELAHNILHHKERLASSRSANGHLFMPSGDESALSRQTEEEADRLAVRLATTAGYDLGEAESFLTGLMKADTPAHEPSTHPALSRRTTLLKAEIAATAGLR